jgi:hypothetical protein
MRDDKRPRRRLRDHSPPAPTSQSAGSDMTARRLRDHSPRRYEARVLIPKDLDRQLLALAARLGSPVGPMVGEWIAEKLDEAEPT